MQIHSIKMYFCLPQCIAYNTHDATSTRDGEQKKSNNLRKFRSHFTVSSNISIFGSCDINVGFGCSFSIRLSSIRSRNRLPDNRITPAVFRVADEVAVCGGRMFFWNLYTALTAHCFVRFVYAVHAGRYFVYAGAYNHLSVTLDVIVKHKWTVCKHCSGRHSIFVCFFISRRKLPIKNGCNFVTWSSTKLANPVIWEYVDEKTIIADRNNILQFQ